MTTSSMSTFWSTIHKWSTLKKSLLALSGIFLLVILLYGKVATYDFANFDDNMYLTTNDDVKNLSYENLQKLFSKQYFGHYQPFTLLVLSVEYAVVGHSPAIFHLSNVAFHLLNILLIFLIIQGLFNSTTIATFTALLIGIHPFNVESVAWIAATNVMLCVSFQLLALLFYLKYLKEKQPSSLILSYGLFFIALLAKSTAIITPLLFFLLDYMVKEKMFSFKNILIKIGYFLPAIAFGLIALTSAEAFGSLGRIADTHTLLERIFISIYAFVFYIHQFIFPFHLTVSHNLPDQLPFYYYISPILIIGLIWGLIFLIKRYPPLKKPLIFGSFFYAFAISLHLQFVSIGDVIGAERYAYLPYIGLAILTSLFIKEIIHHWNSFSKLLKYSLCIGLLSLGLYHIGTTFIRIGVWKKDITLAQDEIKKHPNSHWGYFFMGNSQIRKGDAKAALTYYNKALSIDSTYGFAYYKRSEALFMLKDYMGALKDINTTIDSMPTYPRGYFNKGNILYKIGKRTEALGYYDKGFTLDSLDGEMYFNYGIMLMELKRDSLMIPYFDKANALGFEPAGALINHLKESGKYKKEEENDYLNHL